MRDSMHNRMKEKIARGEKIFGTFFHMGSDTAVECLGVAGLDYLVIDTEHGPFETEKVTDFVRMAELHGFTPLVRIKEISRAAVLKSLDAGAMGLIVPFVKSMEDIHQLIEYGKYSPLGDRGCAPGRAANFGFAPYNDTLRHYFDTCNSATMLIPQCETKECLEMIEEVMSTEGIDGVFIGPIDLSISLGIPGQFESPLFEAAVQRILRAAKANFKFAMIYVGDKATGRKRYEEGFDAIAYKIDTAVYIEAFREIAKEIKGD